MSKDFAGFLCKDHPDCYMEEYFAAYCVVLYLSSVSRSVSKVCYHLKNNDSVGSLNFTFCSPRANPALGRERWLSGLDLLMLENNLLYICRMFI